MDQWLQPLKLREYYVDHYFGSVEESEKQLYLAVIRGDVRARSKGQVLGPQWLKQVSKMKVDDENAFALPPDLELSVEDARGLWGTPTSSNEARIIPTKYYERMSFWALLAVAVVVLVWLIGQAIG